MCGLLESPFEDLEMYSEVLQDSTFELIDAGKMRFASGCSITLSERCNARVFGNLEQYKDKLVLRPQEISNHPEIVRRLGHHRHQHRAGVRPVRQRQLDPRRRHQDDERHRRQWRLRPQRAPGDLRHQVHRQGRGDFSVVPMVSHVDHSEHDVDILVTERGPGRPARPGPARTARAVIDNCVHLTSVAR